MKVFIAISKDNGKIVSGARGHKVFDDISTLRKSIGADSSRQMQARKRGCKVRDLYDVYEYDLEIGMGRVVE